MTVISTIIRDIDEDLYRNPCFIDRLHRTFEKDIVII